MVANNVSNASQTDHIRRGGDGCLEGAFPGISCQATIVPSLRDNSLTSVDKVDSAPPPTNPIEDEDDDEYDYD